MQESAPGLTQPQWEWCGSVGVLIFDGGDFMNRPGIIKTVFVSTKNEMKKSCIYYWRARAGTMCRGSGNQDLRLTVGCGCIWLETCDRSNCSHSFQGCSSHHAVGSEATGMIARPYLTTHMGNSSGYIRATSTHWE